MPAPPSFLDSVKYFWVDHLEIAYVPPAFEFCRRVDNDNSSFWFVDLPMSGEVFRFTYETFEPQWFWQCYKFSVSVRGASVPVFAIMYGATRWKITSHPKIVFYSAFFVVTTNGMLPFSVSAFLFQYFPLVPRSAPAPVASAYETFSPLSPDRPYSHHVAYEIRRLDIALDVDTPLPELLPKFDKLRRGFHAQIWKDKTYKDLSQTYYTNDLQKSKNKYKLVRVYDKILDSFEKNKSWLFPHLSANKEVRRIELELRKNCCENIPFNLITLLESPNNELTQLFQSHMSDYSSFFQKTLKNLTKRDYGKDDWDLKKYFLEHDHLPLDYLASFTGYSKKILGAVGKEHFLSLIQVQLWFSDEDLASFLCIRDLWKFRRCRSFASKK